MLLSGSKRLQAAPETEMLGAGYSGRVEALLRSAALPRTNLGTIKQFLMWVVLVPPISS